MYLRVIFTKKNLQYYCLKLLNLFSEGLRKAVALKGNKEL